MARASLAKRPADVAAMFDAVAARYDLTNDAISLGFDRYWRRLVTAALDPQPGERILDLGTGTGTSAAPLAAAGAWVAGCDFSLGMLRAGAARSARAAGSAAGPAAAGRAAASAGGGGPGRGAVRFVAGDALALPFASASFAGVTCSFGLRNVADPATALRELHRVTGPGGRLVLAEFSHPGWAPVRRVYLAYLLAALPALARLVSSDPQSYDYLVESIRAWPRPAELAQVIAGAGWEQVGWRPATGGIVALHRARRR
jgi:demethylmenaquinone methyltransferase/2-methoxy-6-polyprenyl-1,4-benzoquinol methylase